eukprot:6048739-Prymnesium_polylepis.2
MTSHISTAGCERISHAIEAAEAAAVEHIDISDGLVGAHGVDASRLHQRGIVIHKMRVLWQLTPVRRCAPTVRVPRNAREEDGLAANCKITALHRHGYAAPRRRAVDRLIRSGGQQRGSAGEQKPMSHAHWAWIPRFQRVGYTF